MARKRKDSTSATSDRITKEGGGEQEHVKKKEKMVVEGLLLSMIKSKEMRSAVHTKFKHQKRLEKRKRVKTREVAKQRALELGEAVCLSSFF